MFRLRFVRVGNSNFNIIVFQVNDWVKDFTINLILKEIFKTVFWNKYLSVEYNFQSRIQVRVVFKHLLDVLFSETIVGEDCIIRYKSNFGTISFGGICFRKILYNNPWLNSATLAFPSRTDFTLKKFERAFTALVPTPFRPTDFWRLLNRIYHRYSFWIPHLQLYPKEYHDHNPG